MAGLLKPLPLDPLVSLLWTTFVEAGTYIVEAAHREEAQAEMTAVLIRVFEGLRASEP